LHRRLKDTQGIKKVNFQYQIMDQIYANN